MTRFEREISGQLGEYWKKDAEKEVQKAVAMADSDATVDENGAISWKSNGSYLMDDLCEKLEYAGYPFSREATKNARQLQVAKELDEYRKNWTEPSAEEKERMRAEFGTGTTVVDVLAGRRIKL